MHNQKANDQAALITVLLEHISELRASDNRVVVEQRSKTLPDEELVGTGIDSRKVGCLSYSKGSAHSPLSIFIAGNVWQESPSTN